MINNDISADHRVRLKESEKKDKYVDLARELKRIGALRTIPKGLVQLEDLEIRGQVETIQTTALLKSARILRRVLETCCHSNSSGKPSTNTGVKNYQRNNNNNNIKASKDKMQQNCRCRLCGGRDVTINYIISERSKLAQNKYETRYDWVDMMIHWKLCKKSKFDHTNKWYMHNSASVLENEMHKLLWDFKIQTDHLILAR